MNLDNLCFVTYTHSNCKDVLPPYFASLDRYAGDIKSYVFSDFPCDDYTGHKFFIYDDDKNYCEEFSRLLSSLEEKYFIYMQEDFFITSEIDMKRILRCVELLEDDVEIDYVRLLKCGTVTETPYRDEDGLFYVSNSGKTNYSINSFSMQPTIWKKDRFIELYMSIKRDRFGESKDFANHMNLLDINGLYSFNRESKRGGNHYDSDVFPYTATAIVRGKWNFKEYSKELEQILSKHNIDKEVRGVF